MKKNKILNKLLPLLLVLFTVFGSVFLNKYLAPLFSKEISGFKAESERDRMLNGRFIRWQKYFNIWDDMHFLNKTFGVGFSGNTSSKTMMSGGMHSDYVRLGFGAGIFGLFIYLLFYISLFFRKKKLNKSLFFILNSSIIIMLLYGVSANPLGSSGALIYLTMLTFAFVPNYKIYERK